MEAFGIAKVGSIQKLKNGTTNDKYEIYKEQDDMQIKEISREETAKPRIIKYLGGLAWFWKIHKVAWEKTEIQK